MGGSGARAPHGNGGFGRPGVKGSPREGLVAPGPDLAVECAMRSVAYDMSQRHPAAKRHADLIHASLQMDECPDGADAPAATTAAETPCPDGTGRHWSACALPAQPAEGKTFWVDCADGDDAHPGTKEAPFASVARAQTAGRAAGAGTQIFLRSGVCYLQETLLLTAADSGIAWSSYSGEAVTLSAGAPLAGLKWQSYKGEIMVAELPAEVNASAVDSLFSVPHAGPAAEGSRRHVRARFPNGDSELDRMPTNYDKLGGGAGSTQSWIAAGNRSERFSTVERNSSFCKRNRETTKPLASCPNCRDRLSGIAVLRPMVRSLERLALGARLPHGELLQL